MKFEFNVMEFFSYSFAIFCGLYIVVEVARLAENSTIRGIILLVIAVVIAWPLYAWRIRKMSVAAAWAYAALRKAGLISKDLAHAELSKIDLKKIDLSYANLTGAKLAGTNLFRANLAGANLSSAYLSVANPRRIDLFNGIYLTREEYDNECLGGPSTRATKLIEANLSGADLSQANLKHASLEGAMLSDAKLYGTILSDTNLSGSDLSGAKLSLDGKLPVFGLTQVQLDEACADPNNPPKLDGVLDAETGEQLLWRGGLLNENE